MNLFFNLSSAKDKKNINWLFLLIVWSITLAMFIWNIYSINIYIKNRNKAFIINNTASFIKNHKKELNEILKQRALMYDHIVNIKIGMLKIQDILTRLAAKNNILLSRFGYEEPSSPNNLILNVLYEGKLKNFVNMLFHISEYSYLSLKSIDIHLINKQNKGKYKITMIYNYIIDKK